MIFRAIVKPFSDSTNPALHNSLKMPDFELRDLKENHGHTLTKMPIKCLYTLTIATITTIFIIQSSLQTVPNFIGEYSKFESQTFL